MSNLHLRQVWNTDGLSAAQRLVLVRLADRADAGGDCFPGVASLCRDCKLSERTVREALGTLRQKGHLKVIRRSTFTQPPTYRIFPRLTLSLNLPERQELPEGQNPQGVQNLPERQELPEGQTGGVQNLPGGGAKSAETGVQNLHPNPQKRTHSETPCAEEPPSTEVGSPADVGGGVLVPDDEEVHAFGRAYPGDLPRGIPAKIPEGWTARWLTWRKAETWKPWPRDWKTAMVGKFVLDWQAKHPWALGLEVNGVRESVWTLKTRLEECRKAWAEHPTNRSGSAFDAEAAKDPELRKDGLSLQREMEALAAKIRKG